MQAMIERYRVPLAWGLLVAVVLVAGAFAFVPLAGVHGDLNASLERGYETLGRLKAIAASAGDTREKARELTQQDVARFVFTDAADSDDLALQLRKLVDGIVERTGIQLTSVDNIRSKPEGGVGRGGLLLRVRGDVESIVELLRELENHRPLLVVDNVEMRPGRTRRSRRDKTPAGQAIMLTTRVFGFYLEPST